MPYCLRQTQSQVRVIRRYFLPSIRRFDIGHTAVHITADVSRVEMM